MLPIIALLLVGAAAPVVLPQGPALAEVVKARDAEFFDLFFTGCDPDRLAMMLTRDFEFYHDRDGVVSRSAAPFIDGYRKNCTDRQMPGSWRSRRELVPGSLKVWPIAGYGAVEQGDHLFYERKDNGPERLAGRAAFTQLWALEGGKWKLARVLSYDHEAK